MLNEEKVITMYCESCGSFISEGQAYCSECGAKAPLPVARQEAVTIVPPWQNGETVYINTPKEYMVNRFAKLGMILGIISIPGAYILFTNIVPAVLGLIFSLKGLSKVNEYGGKRQAVVGIVTSCVGISLFLFSVVTYVVIKIKDL